MMNIISLNQKGANSLLKRGMASRLNQNVILLLAEQHAYMISKKNLLRAVVCVNTSGKLLG